MQIDTWIEFDETKLNELLKKNYLCTQEFEKILMNKKLRIYVLTENVYKIAKRMKINSAGLYLGRLKRNEKIQLSVEGAQLIGKKAKKNVVLINEQQALKYLKGENISFEKAIKCEVNNFVILKTRRYIIGSGIFRGEFVENLLPKSRRIITNVSL